MILGAVKRKGRNYAQDDLDQLRFDTQAGYPQPTGPMAYTPFDDAMGKLHDFWSMRSRRTLTDIVQQHDWPACDVNNMNVPVLPTLSEFQVRSMLETLGARISRCAKTKAHTYRDSADPHAVVSESWASGWLLPIKNQVSRQKVVPR